MKEYIKINELEGGIIQIEGQLCIKATDKNIKPKEIMGIAKEDAKKGELVEIKL